MKGTPTKLCVAVVVESVKSSSTLQRERMKKSKKRYSSPLELLEAQRNRQRRTISLSMELPTTDLKVTCTNQTSQYQQELDTNERVSKKSKKRSYEKALLSKKISAK